MRQRAGGAGCVPQIVALPSIVACVVVGLLAFGVLRLRPLESGEIRLEAAADPDAAKAGDVVTYTVTMYNVNVRDELEIISVTDSLLGDLSASFGPTLTAGTSQVQDFEWVFPTDQTEPRDRTVTAYAAGSGEDASSTAVARLELARPASVGAPDLVLERVTDFRGGLTEELPDRCRALEGGEACTFSYEAVAPSDEGSLTNAIEARYRPEGLTDVIVGVASHTVEIVQVSIAVEKSGPAEGIEGEDITYTVDIANTSSDGAPDLVLDRIVDSLTGDLDPGSEGVSTTCTERLASGERCRITYAYAPSAADPTPLLNSVLVESSALGSMSVVTAVAEHSLVVLSPWRRGGGIPAGVEVRTLAICPSDPGVLYAGFGSLGMGVYRSAGAGESWSPTALSDEDVFGIAVDPRDCGTVYAAAWRDGVMKSEDGGRRWDAASDGLAGVFVYSVVIDPTDPDVLYAGTAQQGVYRSEDGGATWRAWGLQPLTASHLSVAPDGRVVIAATWGDGVYRRERRGAGWGAWVGVNDGIPAVHQDVYAVTVNPDDEATVFAATSAGGVYRSLDGGGLWEQVLSSPPRAYSVAVGPGGSGVVYAGTGEGIQRSQELGDSESWEPFDAGWRNWRSGLWLSAWTTSTSVAPTVRGGVGAELAAAMRLQPHR